MRASLARVVLAGCAALWASSAAAQGGLVATQPVGLEAARTIVVRHQDKVQLISQARYVGTPEELVWLLAIPNFNDPNEDGVRVTAFGQPGFDELDQVTRPQIAGECDGEPNGEMSEVLQAPGWGPAPAMALPSRIYTAREREDLDAYLAGLGIDATVDPVDSVITNTIDQNFMFVVVRFTAADVGVAKVDPTVSIEYPLEPGADIRVALLPTSLNTDAAPADLVFWTLGEQRMKFNLSTEALDPEGLTFTSPTTTNYNQVFDQNIAPQQTQAFVTEFASGLDSFADASLQQLVADSGALWLTRLRTRITGAAMRANRVVTLGGAGSAPVSRDLAAAGTNCGEAPADDAGVAEDGGAGDAAVEGDGGDQLSADAGPTPDGGSIGPIGDNEGGGGGGGGAPLCSARPGTAGGLAWLLLFLPLGIRRRR